jgi:hypothetical protein
MDYTNLGKEKVIFLQDFTIYGGENTGFIFCQLD